MCPFWFKIRIVFNPALGMWGVCIHQNFWNCHNLEIIVLCASTFKVLSCPFKGVLLLLGVIFFCCFEHHLCKILRQVCIKKYKINRVVKLSWWVWALPFCRTAWKKRLQNRWLPRTLINSMSSFLPGRSNTIKKFTVLTNEN